MTQSIEIKELAEALSLAQSSMKPAEMNTLNPFFKTNYADLGSIIATAREPLAVNGLSFTQLVNSSPGYISVETILMHKSGQWLSTIIALPLQDKGSRTMAQDAGAVLTYLRRYSLAAILGIYAEQDTDGNDPTKADKKTEKKVEPVNTSTHSSAAMTLEFAENVVTKDGKRYSDLTTEELSYHHNGCVEGLKNTKISAEKREDLEIKRDASEVILASRQANQ